MTQGDSNVNVNRAYQNSWIVYINGIEIPVTSVSVSYGVWQIPQAEIVLVPDVSIQRLGAEDRLAVQIFFCDHWIRPAKPEFRLLFDGEIIGWSYVNVQRGRSVSFTAVDYIQIFTQLFFFFMSSVDDLAIGALNNVTVGADGVNTAGFGPLFPYSLFSKGLLPATANNTESELITRPIEYVRNVVTGFTEDLARRSVPAANFFSPWAKRTKFDRRFVALPYLEESDSKAGVFPILRAVQAGWAMNAVAGLTSNIGTAGSIWQVFEQVLSTLMMELAMIPTPASVAVDKDLNILGVPPLKPDPKIVNNLNCYFVKPQFLFGLPPACNVFYPSQITQFGYQENYATQPTRMYFNDDSWTTYLNRGQVNSTDGLDAEVRAQLTVAHPEEINIAMKAALQDPQLNGKNVLVYPEEFFRGPVIDRRTMPRWFLFLNKAQNAPGVDLDNKHLTQDQIIGINQNIPAGDTHRNVFRQYAAYEYIKERYSRRTAGVSMAFNPYPIPGFPCAVLDRRSTKVDIFAYIMNVRHVLSSRSAQTDISMSYGRTFQEAFGLLRKQIDLENAIVASDRAKVTSSETTTGPGSVNIDIGMERIGPIAVGPAEPLSEIRDRIQNFDRAEDFYKSLLYRAKPKQIDEESRNQQRAEQIRQASEIEGIVLPAEVQQTSRLTDVETYLNTKDAAFLYHKVIRITSDKGKTEDVQLKGIDTTTRIKILATIEKMRAGTASNAELEFMRGAFSQPDLVQQLPAEWLTDPVNPDPEIDRKLNLLEQETQNNFTVTNLHVDADISPKPSAAVLFESFDAAMFYNSRPICTLDEYITFLGVEATVEGRVDPGQALQADSERAFPAPYYRRIRKYRPGPPKIIPDANYTNAAVLTSADGVYSVPLVGGELGVEEARAAFTALGPGQTTTTSTPAEPVAEPAAAAGSEFFTPVTETATPGAVVQGIPDDFPQTSKDWDTILFAYRSNVLARLAPGT